MEQRTLRCIRRIAMALVLTPLCGYTLHAQNGEQTPGEASDAPCQSSCASSPQGDLDETPLKTRLIPRADYSLAPGTILRVVLVAAPRLSRLSPGSTMRGELYRSLYSGDREVVPSGSRVRLIVDGVQKENSEQTRSGNVFGLFKRLYRKLRLRHSGYSLRFRSVNLSLPDNCTVSADVSFVRVIQVTSVQPKAEQNDSAPGLLAEPEARAHETEMRRESIVPMEQQGTAKRQAILILKLEKPILLRLPKQEPFLSVSFNNRTSVSVHSHARLTLLSDLSASKNHRGDLFQARLDAPISLAGQIVPEGSIFEGRIAQQVPPRRLYRSAVLRLKFDRILPSSGPPVQISASLDSAEVDRRLELNVDSEGTLRARRPGMRTLALELAAAYAIGKVVDDSVESGIKLWAAETASGAAATVARYFGIGTGLAIQLSRRGRDVKLPKYSELDVAIGRAAQLPSRSGLNIILAR